MAAYVLASRLLVCGLWRLGEDSLRLELEIAVGRADIRRFGFLLYVTGEMDLKVTLSQ